MPANIFINYRKDDSRWNTQALYNELLKYFPKDSIFKDFNTIGLGDDYVVSINNALEQCDVLLVIIGKAWLQMKNAQGVVRLTDPTDWVRIEIATALRRNIKVIPVLFDNVDMFAAQDLPEDMQGLVRRQHLTVSDTKFETDVKRLADEIKKILQVGQKTISASDINKRQSSSDQSTSSIRRWRTGIICGIVAILLLAIACFLLYANDQRFLMQGVPHLIKYSLSSGAFGGLLWVGIGAVTGNRKYFLQSALIGAIAAVLLWIMVFGTYSDTIWAGFIFGTAIGGALGILIAWLLKKTKEK